MDRTALYFRQNVQVEPLSDSWYAWPHLIPPATNSRNIVERHLRIMDSYIQTPQIHASAVANPKMMGGPFIDHGGKRVDEIRELRNKTALKRAELLRLAAAFDQLDTLLRTNAKGYSLHPLYPQVPELLRGYVELTYDLYNQPSYRIIEPLIYKSRFYDKSAQTIMLSHISGDDRPFVLSTPRLPCSDTLQLQWDFADDRLDTLFRLKRKPQLWSEVRSALGIAGEVEGQFRGFFNQEPPSQYVPYAGRGVRWRYFGHACILIEAHGISILADPVLSYTYESSISRYTYSDLPDSLDFVVITHNHQDHVLLETLLQLRHKIKHIVVPRNGSGQMQDPSLKLTLEAIGFRNVIELAEMETLPFQSGSLVGVPFFGEHADLAIATKLSYLVRIGPYSLLLAADSCNLEPAMYEHLHREIGDIDVLFLGMECDGAPLSWLYGPLISNRPERAMDESRRLSGSNYDQAVAIVNALRCGEVYVYAMGQEPWLNHVMSIKYSPESRPIVHSNRLIQYCHSQGLPAERLFGEKEILLESPRKNRDSVPVALVN
jgi:L-ascorbate metabolism protein UlaG (beta-lactamase superfamily)